MASYDNVHMYAMLNGRTYRIKHLPESASMIVADPVVVESSFEQKKMLLPGEDEAKFRYVCELERIEGEHYPVGYQAHVAAEECGRLVTAVNMLPPSWRNAIDDSVSRAGKAYDEYVKSITTNA